MILQIVIIGAGLFLSLFCFYEAYLCWKRGYFGLNLFSEMFEERYTRDEHPIRFQLGFFSEIFCGIMVLILSIIMAAAV